MNQYASDTTSIVVQQNDRYGYRDHSGRNSVKSFQIERRAIAALHSWASEMYGFFVVCQWLSARVPSPMFERKILISAVKSRPALWHHTHKDFKKSNKTDKQWEEVARLCHASNGKWYTLRELYCFWKTKQSLCFYFEH